jgi:pyridoxal phosphate enzyme (YggS family)
MSDAASTRLEAVQTRIVQSARLADRDPAEVTLVAVSKMQPPQAIEPLLAAGQLHFGENRVQEAVEKWEPLRARYSGVQLHLVGQLQSNKALAAVQLFEFIHSLDRPSLVEAIRQAMETTGRRPGCFVQVNVGGEAQKGGCAPDKLPELLELCTRAALPVTGLMCIPPAGLEAAPYFALLAALARRNGLDGLSMGMSGDFATAVMLGATHVRVGTSLFGPRE